MGYKGCVHMDELNKDLKLSKEVAKSLEQMKFVEWTEVQKQCIPLVAEGVNLVVKAETGSGKTGAYGIPLIHNIDWSENLPQVLVLVPTRELATQVSSDLFAFGRYKKIKVATLVGQISESIQRRELNQKVHMVVATVGRCLDLIKKGIFNPSKIQSLVLDEADEMLNLGFVNEVNEIIDFLPEEHQTLLFSATLNSKVKSWIEDLDFSPSWIEVVSESSVFDRITPYALLVGKDDKFSSVLDVLVMESSESAILFCNQRETVDALKDYLRRQGVPCLALHGAFEQEERFEVMRQFKEGKVRYLIATDVAARGLDIENVPLIINVDVPHQPDIFIHRMGRSARLNKLGIVVSIYTQNQRKYLDSVESKIHRPIHDYPHYTDQQVASKKDDFFQLIAKKPKKKGFKKEQIHQDIQRLKIKGGTSAKMRPGDIVGAICSLDGIQVEDIGAIFMHELYCEVDIYAKGDEVFDKLSATPIKGKIRKISKIKSEG